MSSLRRKGASGGCCWNEFRLHFGVDFEQEKATDDIRDDEDEKDKSNAKRKYSVDDDKHCHDKTDNEVDQKIDEGQRMAVAVGGRLHHLFVKHDDDDHGGNFDDN